LRIERCAEATVAFGVPLGGGENVWTFTENVDDHGRWNPPWLAYCDDEIDDDDVVSQAEEQLCEAGFYESWRSFDSEGVGISRYGYPDNGGFGYVLRIWQCTVNASQLSESIDFAALERRRIERDWDGRIRDALSTLDIRPATEPRWLLMGSYGWRGSG
jgi:hypothetical protein